MQGSLFCFTIVQTTKNGEWHIVGTSYDYIPPHPPNSYVDILTFMVMC